MIAFLSTSPYFGVVLTLSMFSLAYVINRRWPSPFTTPLFLATVFIILIMLVCLITFIVSLTNIIKWKLDSNKTENQVEEINKIVKELGGENK